MTLQYKQELEPKEILDQAINDEGIDSFYVGYSGGKDSGIALDYTAKYFPDNFKGVIFADTGIGTQATIDFVKKYCKERNYPLNIVKPENVIRKKTSVPFSYKNLVMRYGFPSPSGHTMVMQQLKLFPIRQFIHQRIKAGEKPCIITGIRKKESARRNRTYFTPIDKDGKMVYVKPLFYKTNEWVYRYFVQNDVKRSPVYETLHISGDCLCGCFAKKGEAKLIQMFHPEVYDKILKLEAEFKKINDHPYKAFGSWGTSKIAGDGIDEVKAQTTIESYLCSDCILDRSATDEDTKRFNDEFENIEAKLDKL